MKKLITNYTFNKTAKTVTFNDYSNINLGSILLITNVKSNTIIYNFTQYGGSISGNILTLSFDTTSMNNSDPLQIWYDDAVYNQYDAENNLKISESNIENPFGTPNGQLQVSVAESYFARIGRYGRITNGAFIENVSLTQNVEQTFYSIMSPVFSINKIVVPEKIIVSCTVDAIVKIRLFDTIQGDSYTYYGGYLRAGVPLEHNFSGSIQIMYQQLSGSTGYGGIDLLVTAKSAGGTINAYGMGWLLDDV